MEDQAKLKSLQLRAKLFGKKEKNKQRQHITARQIIACALGW